MKAALAALMILICTLPFSASAHAECANVVEFGVGTVPICGSPGELAYEVQICNAHYDALTIQQQNGIIGTRIHSHCSALMSAKDRILSDISFREQERQRIRDALLRLRALEEGH